MLSTGKAAELCCVTPDTVLKWIKTGHLKATRTAGGHYRISTEAVAPYLAKEAKVPDQPGNAGRLPYCWDFYAKNGKLNDCCKICLAFKAHAQRCYIIAKLGKQAGHGALICRDSCDECRYYKLIQEIPLKVLVITEKKNLFEAPQPDEANIELRLAGCEYEVSSAIRDFHPDFIILDSSLASSDPQKIYRHLRNDPQTDEAVLVLAVKKKAAGKPPKGVKAVTVMPDTLGQLDEYLRGIFDKWN
jgi:excisionase family DNA binding protein